MEGEIQNQTQMIMDRLDAVDAALAQLMERWNESTADRARLNERMAAMERERAELLEKARQYQEAIEVRMQAVESRDAITDIRETVTELRTAVTEVQAAAALQIAIHQRWKAISVWWKKPRSKAWTAVGAMAMFSVTSNLPVLARYLFWALLHRLGLH